MVYKTKYSWRNVRYPVKAEDAGTELERIQAKYGEVTPKNLLDESRPVTAVMHNCYEWNDTVAAEKWRLQQSRHIMSCLTVTYESVEDNSDEIKTIEVRAFQNVSPEREGRFLHVKNAMESPEYRHELMLRALRELAEYRKKYTDLSELAKVIGYVDQALAAANNE